MAEQVPPDSVPAWAVALSSVVTTVLAWRAWTPIGAWIAHRLDVGAKARAQERADIVTTLSRQVDALGKELAETRQDLREEQMVRASMAVDNAVLNERVENLQKQRADDKRECQQEIARLRAEIREIRGDRKTPARQPRDEAQ